MDIKILKTKFPLLLKYLQDRGVSRGTLYNYRREISLMLQNEHRVSDLESYCQHIEGTCGCSGRYLYNRLACIKRIWNYVLFDKLPILSSKEDSLSVDYKNLLDLCKIKSKQLGHKEKTTLDYVHAVHHFLLYLQNSQICSLQDVTESIIHDYFTESNVALRSITISGRLRRFLVMCEDVIGTETVKRLKAFIPDIPKKILVYPDLSDLESKSIEKILTSNDNQLTNLERAIGCLAFYTGLRCSDIISLTRENIDFKSKTIIITQQKTNIPIRIPMPTICSNTIVKYVKETRPNSTCRNIFVHGQTGSPMHRRDLYDISNNILHCADIRIYGRKMRGLHLFRHHFASSLISNNTDISIAAALLGHSDPKSTFVYLGTDVDKLRTCALQLL